MSRASQPRANRPDISHSSAGALLDCPSCGLPAEIVERFTLDGSPEPVEHVRLVCVNRHWFTLPIDGLPKLVAGGSSSAQVGDFPRQSRSARSIVRRAIAWLKELWEEYDYAQRRLLEMQLGVPMR